MNQSLATYYKADAHFAKNELLGQKAMKSGVKASVDTWNSLVEGLWRLISAQLSNVFGNCPSWTVSNILQFYKHNRLSLGPIWAFISNWRDLYFFILWSVKPGCSTDEFYASTLYFILNLALHYSMKYH